MQRSTSGDRMITQSCRLLEPAAFGGLFGFGGGPLRFLGGGSSDAGWDMVSAGCSCLSLYVILPVTSSSLSMTELVPLVLPTSG